MKTNRLLLSKREQIQKMISMPTIVLAAEEADRFIDYIVDQSVLKNNARVVKMVKETRNLRAMGMGEGRFLKPGATFSASDYLKTLAQQRIQLVSKKLRGCVVIYDDDLEDNVEADAFADHVMKMVAAKIANELDEAFWIGDTGSLGGFANTDIRSLFDGWRYRVRYSQVTSDPYWNTVSGRGNLATALSETAWATSQSKAVGDIVVPTTGNGYCYICTVAGSTHGTTEPTWPVTRGTTVVDNTVTWRCHAFVCALGGKIAEQNSQAPYNWEFKYGVMLKKLPSEYKQVGLANLRFFQSDQIAQDYVNALAARSTILGDQAILGQGPLAYGQVPIVACPLMPVTMSAGGVVGAGVYGDCLLTHRYNLVVGIQRDIKIESSREAADEATYWYYTMRGDSAIENVNACVLLEKIVVG